MVPDRPQSRRQPRSAARRASSVCWAALLGLVLLAGCGESGHVIAKGPPDANSDVVSFASTVPYARALRLLTDAGTQPAIDCGSFIGDQTRVGWQPQGQRAAFARDIPPIFQRGGRRAGVLH